MLKFCYSSFTLSKLLKIKRANYKRKIVSIRRPTPEQSYVFPIHGGSLYNFIFFIVQFKKLEAIWLVVRVARDRTDLAMGVDHPHDSLCEIEKVHSSHDSRGFPDVALIVIVYNTKSLGISVRKKKSRC